MQNFNRILDLYTFVTLFFMCSRLPNRICSVCDGYQCARDRRFSGQCDLILQLRYARSHAKLGQMVQRSRGVFQVTTASSTKK